MQIFVKLNSGKTVCMDVTQNTRIEDVLAFINTNHLREHESPYTTCLFYKAFYEKEHPMAVQANQPLSAHTQLEDLFQKKIIKEITLLTF